MLRGLLALTSFSFCAKCSLNAPGVWSQEELSRDIYGSGECCLRENGGEATALEMGKVGEYERTRDILQQQNKYYIIHIGLYIYKYIKKHNMLVTQYIK